MARIPWSQRPSAADKLTVRMNETMRINILDEQPELIHIHYIGRQYQCPVTDCFFCESGIERRERLVVNTLVYAQDNGVLKQPFDGTIIPWSFGIDKHLVLQAFAAQGDLRTRDIMVTCFEEKYQKFVMTLAEGHAIWLQDAALKTKVMDMYSRLPADLAGRMAIKINRADMATVMARRQGPAGGPPQPGRDPRTAVQPYGAPPAQPWGAPPPIALPPIAPINLPSLVRGGAPPVLPTPYAPPALPAPSMSPPPAALIMPTLPPPGSAVPPAMAVAPVAPAPGQVDRLKKLLD